jgi:pimeloyl-ACP methyl ester carboxylesterase
MSLPTLHPITIPLPSTFNHASWTIKYALISSQPTKIPPPIDHQTLVLIHGTPWSSAVFSPLARSLLSTHPHLTLLLYDLPGYGQSQHLNASATTPDSHGFTGSTSIATQASALTALLSHLHLDGKGTNPKPAVLAHDIAGTIALRAHLLQGVEFAGLMMLDTNAVLPWGDGFYTLVRSEPSVFTRLPAHVHEAAVRAVVRSASVNLEQEWEDVLVGPWIGSEELQQSFVRQIAQASDGDVGEMVDADMYGEVRCGVRVLWGEGDRWIPRWKMEKLCGMLGERLEKGLVVVEGAGHLVMLDQPGRVEEEVREWLGLE